MENNIPYKHIIFFDGECGLCNRTVQWVLKKDKKKQFHYATLQSDFAQTMLQKENISISMDTIILYSNGKIYFKSAAVLHILYIIGGYWKLFSYLKVFPTIIRDGFYNLIAANRYRFFGKKQQCMIPTPSQRAQFIDTNKK